MIYSDIKHVKEQCEMLHSDPDWREVVRKLDSGESDFWVDGVRFIDEWEIDNVMADELASDLYTLGCFNDWFLADILDIDIDVIQAMQEAEAFEAIGKLIISLDKLPELAEQYARADGYGHHFNSYDFGEEMLGFHPTRGPGWDFYIFDNRS